MKMMLRNAVILWVSGVSAAGANWDYDKAVQAMRDPAATQQQMANYNSRLGQYIIIREDGRRVYARQPQPGDGQDQVEKYPMLDSD